MNRGGAGGSGPGERAETQGWVGDAGDQAVHRLISATHPPRPRKEKA